MAADFRQTSAAVPEQHKKYILPKLIAKPIRSASGIAVVAVMCKPHRCPHIAYTGNICVYCPGTPFIYVSRGVLNALIDS